MATSNNEVYHIEKLTDETAYSIWKFQITVSFKAFDIFDIVDGTNSLTAQTTAEAKTKWKKNDAKAQNLIVTSIDKKYIMHIMDCETSKEMFDKIKMIFEKNTNEQVFNLWQEFYSYKCAKGVDISTQIAKVESIVHKLKSLNQQIDDT